MYRVLILCLLAVVSSHVRYKDVEVHTGTVRGYAAEDGDYFAFLGVPYAAPLTSERRFKVALPVAPWDGTFSANRTVQCPQFCQGDEDCLIINVFTPTKIYNGPLPVLVYIHGGAFFSGKGPTGGVGLLVRQNIIVVTINYRLGALGFLCLGNEEAPGNVGLRDQIAALKWVQTNIIEFGGNPDQVTLYGTDAGAASVDLLVLSKVGKDLFKQAIIESGTARNVWAVAANPIQTARNFAGEFGYVKKNLYDLARNLRLVPVKAITVSNYLHYQNLTDGTYGFVPCVEKKVNSVETIIAESPQMTMKKSIHRNVPIMFIFADVEGLFLSSYNYYTLSYRDRMNSDFKSFMPADLVFDTLEISDEITENVRNFYFGNQDVSNDTLINYLNYFGDSLVLHELLSSAIHYSNNGNPVYLMKFAYKGKLGNKEKYFDHLKRAGHGDAVRYVILNEKIENSDKLAVERMTKIVANFVKYGNPTPSRSDLLPITWPQVTSSQVFCLHFGNEMTIIEEPHWERKTFWDRIYEAYRREIYPLNNTLM